MPEMPRCRVGVAHGGSLDHRGALQPEPTRASRSFYGRCADVLEAARRMNHIHAEADLEIVTLPCDDDESDPFIFRGVRYCTVCFALIINVGEDVQRIEVTA